MARAPVEKVSVDIERLLVWAYRDELSKLHTSSAEGIWDQISDFGMLGGIDVVPPDGSGSGQRYDLGIPDPDAQAIEAAVGRLSDLIIDWEQSREAILGDLAQLFATRDVLMVRPLKTAALVTMHAKMNSRPDWHEASPRPHFIEAQMGPRNRPTVVGECRGRNFYSTGSYCPLGWSPSPVTIAMSRAEYAAWHRGLCLLAETLQLERHHALPPVAPALPWSDEPHPRYRIFAIGERAPKIPIRPPREWAGPPARRLKAGPVRKIPIDKGASR